MGTADRVSMVRMGGAGHEDSGGLNPAGWTQDPARPDPRSAGGNAAVLSLARPAEGPKSCVIVATPTSMLRREQSGVQLWQGAGGDTDRDAVGAAVGTPTLLPAQKSGSESTSPLQHPLPPSPDSPLPISICLEFLD